MLQGTVQPFGNNHKKGEEKKACFDVVSLAHPICFGVQTGCCVQSLLIKMSSFTVHPLSLNTPCKLVSRPFKWQCCFSVPLSAVYLPPDRVVSHAVRCQTLTILAQWTWQQVRRWPWPSGLILSPQEQIGPTCSGERFQGDPIASCSQYWERQAISNSCQGGLCLKSARFMVTLAWPWQWEAFQIGPDSGLNEI